MNNRITQLFERKSQNILNIYCTAGFPNLEDTVTVIEELEKAGADLVELGIPYSDPIADGPTIQESNQQALNNGMSLPVLFEQLKDIRQRVSIPLILMGYINPVMQFGIEKFCAAAAEVGVDGLILPDLPMLEFENVYKPVFEAHQLSHSFLISPQTSEERIMKIDELSSGFIYMVSSDSTTGKTKGISETQKAYFQRIQGMGLKNPRLIGFGISNHESFATASQYAQGAIIGSAFIKAIRNSDDLGTDISNFVAGIRGQEVNQSIA